MTEIWSSVSSTGVSRPKIMSMTLTLPASASTSETWPSKDELRNYSVAVIVSLVVFGVALWLVDTGIVALLVGYTSLGA